MVEEEEEAGAVLEMDRLIQNAMSIDFLKLNLNLLFSGKKLLPPKHWKDLGI